MKTPGRTKSRDLLLVLAMNIGDCISIGIEETNNIRAKIQRYKGQPDELGRTRNYVTRMDRKRHCITVERV